MRMKKAIAAATVAGLAFGLLGATASPAAAVETPAWTKLPGNTAIAAQKSANGKIVNNLHLKDGELYTAYGDYGANTGPVNVASINVSTNKVTNWLSVASEATETIREINGKLYLPQIDPRTDWNLNAGYTTNASGQWAHVNATPFVHVLDVTSSDGKDLWLAGSAVDPKSTVKVPEGAATIKRSVDGGKTWTTEKLRNSSPAREFDRNYWMQGVNGKVYTSANISGAPVEYWQAGKWSTVANPQNYSNPGVSTTVVAFKDKILYPVGNTVHFVDTTTNTLGKAANDVGPYLYDIYVDNASQMAYALSTNGIWRSADGVKWEYVTRGVPQTGSAFSSLAVDTANKRVYVGGTDGQVYSGVLGENPITAPTVTGATDTTIVAGTPFDLSAGVTATDAADGDLTASTYTYAPDFDPYLVGTYKVEYYVTNSSQLTTIATRTITVTPAPAPLAPAIRGAEGPTYWLQSNPVDPLAAVRAVDVTDGDITGKLVVTGTVDVEKVGSQKITYSVTNSKSMTTTLVREYIIIKKDPTIVGAGPKTVMQNTIFDPKAGVTATDAFAPTASPENSFAGDATADLIIMGTVDTTKPGDYTVTYSLTNAYGLTTTVARVITVKAAGAPVISGIDNINLTVTRAFNPKTGVKVVDPQDGVITAKLVVTGTVNTNVVGAYPLTYSATNSFGVTTTVTRIVTVVPNSAPTVTSTITAPLARNAVYNALSTVTIVDADKDRIVNFSYSTNVDTAVAGTYSTTYMVTDSAGQTSTQKISITVK